MKANNPKTVKELREHFAILNAVGRIPELPIARTLAISINRMNRELEPHEEKIEALIESYATTDASGKRLGVEYEKEDKTKERRVLEGTYPYDWIDMKEGKRKEFDDKLKKLLETKVKFEYVPVKADREVSVIVPRLIKNGETETVANCEVKKPMMEVLEKKIPVATLAFILDTIIDGGEN